MGTTDVHGRLFPYDYYSGHTVDRGLALLAPLMDSVRAAHPGHTYLFDSGDLLQGNPLAFVYARQYGDQPNPIITGMNLLGYDAAAIGNHEFNYGLAHLDRAIDQAHFPFLSANIFQHDSTAHAYRPYVLLPHVTATGDTILIGVTGNTPPGVAIWDKGNVQGRLDFRDVVASVRPVVAEMRARGADLIVVLSHGGLEGTSYDTLTTGLSAENAAAALARAVPDIDVIFLGHTHRELADTTINGVLLTQAKNWAQSLAVVDLQMRQRAPDDWTVVRKGATLLRPRLDLVDRAFMDSLRWEHERAVAWVNSRVGRATERMDARNARVRDTPLIDFVNEVQRRAAGTDLSATAAFDLSAVIPQGDVTIADIAALYPYDNTLKAIRITGAQLRAYLEKAAQYYNSWPPPAGGTVTNRAVPGYNFDIVSGVDYVLDISRPVGQRVVELQYQGQPVRPDQTFTLALNNYRQAGGGGYSMIADAPVVYDHQQDIRELLIEEVRRRGTISPGNYFHQNWRLEPAAAVNAAAREQAAPRRSPPTTNAPEHKRLRVLATNDFHGRLLPDTPEWANGRAVGGAATLASYFRFEHAGFAGPMLLVDGGDVMQGTPISNLTRGRASVEFFNQAGYIAAAVGNHDFDWSADSLRARMAEAHFAWLSANIVVAGTDTAPSWLQPTRMVTVDSVRVGIIGLTTKETPSITKTENIAGLQFRDGGAAIDHWVPILRREGAEFVVVIAHSGASCSAHMTNCQGEIMDWAREVHQRPDLIVAGHTHRVVRTRVNGIPVVEAGAYGTHYGVIDLQRIGPDSVFTWIRGTPTAFDDRVPPDSAVAALVEQYRHLVGPSVDRVVTTLAEDLPNGRGEFALGRLVADAERWATHAQAAIINNGGIRGDLEAGSVTWGDAYRIQPFHNKLIRLLMRGAQIRAVMEKALEGRTPSIHVSGLLVYYNPQRPAGSRVVSLWLDSGVVVHDDELYSVTVPDFLASGTGAGFHTFGAALSRKDTGIFDVDALVDYLKSLPRPVAGPPDARFRIAPAAGGGAF